MEQTRLLPSLSAHDSDPYAECGTGLLMGPFRSLLRNILLWEEDALFSPPGVRTF